MFDKNLLIKRFAKSLNIYADNAFIQKKMADKLLSLIPNRKYENVLEIGCGSGLLTNKFTQRFEYSNYLATDIVEECKKYINVDFQQIDMDNIVLKEKYDLIISNACVQWSKDFEELIKKISKHLNKDGIIALTSFGNKNMQEIKALFNVGLEYKSIENIEQAFQTLSKIDLQEEIDILKFDSLLAVLKHIKNTGTNVFSSNKITKNQLIDLSKNFKDKYNNKLTYNPIYIIYKK